MSEPIINLIKLKPDAEDAEIVAQYNRQSHTPLPPEKIYDWLAANARRHVLRRFAEDHDAGDTPQVTALRSAVETLLDALRSDRVTLDLSPGSAQRQLVEAVSRAGLPGVGPDDVAELIERAQTRELIDEAAVVAARESLARREAVNARRAALQAWLDQQLSVLDAAVDDPTIELPGVPA